MLSSRVWIKQENAVCQTLLCHWAEPFTALAQVALGKTAAPGYLATAWKWLLQNHPHDFIGGCSIDAVHADMHYRFHQSHRIARLTLEATEPGRQHRRPPRAPKKCASSSSTRWPSRCRPTPT